MDSKRRYLVICRGDRKPNGTKGEYELATHKFWRDENKAKGYAATCAPSREAVVIVSIGPLEFREAE